MDSSLNKIEFVGNVELTDVRCGCCSKCIGFSDNFYTIQPLQIEIYRILFENIQLKSDIICSSCDLNLLNIHLFRVDVRKKLSDFLELETKIKAEPNENVLIDFVKSESPEHDYEEQTFECLIEDTSEQITPFKKRRRRVRNEVSDGKRKAGLTYDCVLCKKFTSDNKKDYADHILLNHAINHDKNRNQAVEDPRSKMIESRALPEPRCSVQCDYCGSMYNTKKNLYAHMKIHVEERNQVKCVDCNKTFRDLRVMVRHRNKEHGDGIKFWCYCGNEFDNKRDLNRCRYAHGRNKVPEKLEDTCYECKVPKAFKSVRQLLAHKNKYHGNGTRFWCIRCGVVYSNREDQTICVRKHYNDVLKDILVKCPECGKELLHNSLGIHLKSVHRQSKEVVCHQCGKGFCAIARLTIHMKQVHNNGYKPWICDNCGRSWAQKKSLRDHLLKTHVKYKKTYQCHICHKVCQNSLDRHLLLVHPNGHDNGIRANPQTNLYHCPNCIQTFSVMKSYEVHVNENLCQNYNYEGFDQTKNAGKKFNVFTEGSFKCNVCNSVQKSIAKLRRHIHYLHSGEIDCPICDKKMKCKGAVIGHLKKVHKTNYTTIFGKKNQRDKVA